MRTTTAYKVFVYKTDVVSPQDADAIVETIKKCYPDHIVFFDLQQEDRLLWVEGWNTKNLIIVDALLQLGYTCEFSPDKTVN